MNMNHHPFKNTIEMVDKMVECMKSEPEITEHYRVYFRTCRILESVCSYFHENDKKIGVFTNTGIKVVMIPSCLDRCTPENGCTGCKRNFLKHYPKYYKG